MGGDSFDFKMFLTIFSLQEQSFRVEIFNSNFFVDKSVLLSQLTLLTENSLANCFFSKKGILQIIRNSNSNKAQLVKTVVTQFEIIFKT